MMPGNRSSAVMQQRAEPVDSLDDFPSPPWAGRALCEMLAALGLLVPDHYIWECACNRGYLARGLADTVGPDRIYGTDIFDYGWPGMAALFDFLSNWSDSDLPDVDWVITNPPFKDAAKFIRLGLERARIGVAVLVRVAFDEGAERYETLFADTPETYAFPFVERVVMHRAALREPGSTYWDPRANDGKGDWKKASTATAYQWLVWVKGAEGRDTIKRRIPPCRKRLERPGDYPPPDQPPAGDDLFSTAPERAKP